MVNRTPQTYADMAAPADPAASLVSSGKKTSGSLAGDRGTARLEGHHRRGE
jgi:hypothetical protein